MSGPETNLAAILRARLAERDAAMRAKVAGTHRRDATGTVPAGDDDEGGQSSPSQAFASTLRRRLAAGQVPVRRDGTVERAQDFQGGDDAA